MKNNNNSNRSVGRPSATIKYPKTVFTFATLKERNSHVQPLTVFKHLHADLDGGVIKMLAPDRKGTKGAPQKRYVPVIVLKAQRQAVLAKKKVHVIEASAPTVEVPSNIQPAGDNTDNTQPTA